MAFPKSTTVNKIMPKEAFYKNLTLKPEVKNAFVSDIKRIVWKNKLSANTLNIEKGESVSEILVLQIELKVKNYNPKILETVSKTNAHNILYILTFENETQTALFYNKLYKTEWKQGEVEIELNGLDMDSVWENLVKSVELGIRNEELSSWDDNLSLDNNIALHEKQEKLQKEIERLEKQARNEKQPNKKFEFVRKLNQMKKDAAIYDKGRIYTEKNS